MKSNESECKSEKNHMLTSFFVRFNTSITKKEIASKIIDDATAQTIRIVLPCDPKYSVCVKEDEDESYWIFEFDDCIDIDLDEER